ncbi:hypothetical protein GIB67_026846, partial [Kingdonia uniflora]
MQVFNRTQQFELAVAAVNSLGAYYANNRRTVARTVSITNFVVPMRRDEAIGFSVIIVVVDLDSRTGEQYGIVVADQESRKAKFKFELHELFDVECYAEDRCQSRTAAVE